MDVAHLRVGVGTLVVVVRPDLIVVAQRIHCQVHSSGTGVRVEIGDRGVDRALRVEVRAVHVSLVRIPISDRHELRLQRVRLTRSLRRSLRQEIGRLAGTVAEVGERGIDL